MQIIASKKDNKFQLISFELNVHLCFIYLVE